MLLGLISGGAGLPGALTYSYTEVTSTGAFTSSNVIPANAVYYRVRAYGAGGGGGASYNVSSTSGGYGGNGGIADTGLVANDGSAKTVSGSVGAGGTGSVNGSVATAGGTTTVAVGPYSLTANGGDRGRNYSESSVGGAGGTASGGTVNITGAAGATTGVVTSYAIGGLGGLGYPGLSLKATQAPSQTVTSNQGSGTNGQPGGVLIEWWTQA